MSTNKIVCVRKLKTQAIILFFSSLDVISYSKFYFKYKPT